MAAGMTGVGWWLGGLPMRLILALLALASAQSAVVEVTTAEEMQAAFTSQSPLIMITAHIALGPTELPDIAGTASMAIWGNCSTPLPADIGTYDAPAAYIKPRACGISSTTFTPITQSSGRLWFSNIVFYSPLASTDSYAPPPAPMGIAVFSQQARLWMANVVVLGANFTGVRSLDSDVTLVDSAFVHNGEHDGYWAYGLGVEFVALKDSAPQTLVMSGCQFISIAVKVGVTNFNGVVPVLLQNTTVIVSDSVIDGPRKSPADTSPTCTGMCVLYDLAAATFPLLYTDLPASDTAVSAETDKTFLPVSLSKLHPLSNLSATDVQPTQDEMSWLTTLTNAGVPGAVASTFSPITIPPAPPQPDTGGDGSGTPTTLPKTPGAPTPIAPPPSTSKNSRYIVIGCIVAAAVLIGVAVFALWYKRTARNRHADSFVPLSLTGLKTASSERPPSVSIAANASYTHTLDGMKDSTLNGETTIAESNPEDLPPRRPGQTQVDSLAHRENGYSKAEQVQQLQTQLDVMYEQRSVLLNRYRLLSWTQRRVGGQGVVQFARGHQNANLQYALKFFLDRRAFQIEEVHYRNDKLRHILPPVEDVVSNEDGQISFNGKPLPPMVVTERGESLDEWAQRCQPDFLSSMHIITHLAQRICELHDTGLVHCDLKPANCIYLRSRNHWTLIDFGCAAICNTVTPLSLSLAYAAPESVRAFSQGERHVVASFAVDVWALGIMAYELLTGTRVFLNSSRDTVLHTMLGHAHLPWEGPATPEKVADLAKLGFLGPAILRMLDRDPSRRIALDEVQVIWKQHLQAQTRPAGISIAVAQLQ